MKRFLTLSLTLLLLGSGSGSFAAEADSAPSEAGGDAALVNPERVDQVLGALVESQALVGVSALIYEQGREVYSGAFGMADREAQKPLERDTIAQIYSMTKPITGVALMTLYEEGKFQLDDPLAKYLPEFADMRVYAGEVDGKAVYEPLDRPITVYDILRHTAGFSPASHDSPVGALHDAAEPFDNQHDLAEMTRRLSSVPLLFQPGTQWLYGPSVDVQARLAEKLSGTPFDVLLEERIFAPLRMHDTAHFVPDDKRARMSAMYVRDEEEGSFQRRPDEEAFRDYFRDWSMKRGGSGLTSTLDDYMRFARTLLNGGELDGVRILQPETIELMATDALSDEITERSWLPTKGSVGFGIDFAVRKMPPVNDEEASGAVGEFFWDGFANTLFWVDPENQLTAVLFTQYIPYGGVDLHKQFRDAIYRSPNASAAVSDVE